MYFKIVCILAVIKLNYGQESEIIENSITFEHNLDDNGYNLRWVTVCLLNYIKLF